MSVSSISSMTSISPVGTASPIAPAPPVERVSRRRKTVTPDGKVIRSPLLAAASAESMSTTGVLSVLIGLRPGG